MTNAVEDFENAPIGATATRKATGSRAMKMYDYELGPRWIAQNWVYLDDEEMETSGYTLDTPAPTTVPEALELVWELAHEVKPGQVIPKGTRYLTGYNSEVKEYTAQFDIEISFHTVPEFRTLEPLPDPEPDWLDALAVIAIAESFSYRRTWVPVGDGYWVSVEDGRAHWRELTDVTPLYPKEQDS